MADDNDNNRSPGSGPNFQTRTWIVWIVIAAMIPLLLFFQKSTQPRYQIITYKQLFELVEAGSVEGGEINFSSQSQYLRTVKGRYAQVEGGKTNVVPFMVETYLAPDDVRRLQMSGAFRAVDNNNLFLQVLIGLLPFVVVAALIWFVFVRQIKAAKKLHAAFHVVASQTCEYQNLNLRKAIILAGASCWPVCSSLQRLATGRRFSCRCPWAPISSSRHCNQLSSTRRRCGPH